ncbi:hypothetical protein C8R46DRAFT_1196093 [Mycena filopes]|nr:hypothetical protein C8R46DRAFT_1196093 [Mycena filopes]
MAVSKPHLRMPGGSWTIEDDAEGGFSALPETGDKTAGKSPGSTQEPYQSQIVTLDAAKLSEEIVLLASPSSSSRETIRVRVSPDSDIEEVLPFESRREVLTRTIRASPHQRRSRCLDIFPEIKHHVFADSTGIPSMATMPDAGWDFPQGDSGDSPSDAEDPAQNEPGLGLIFPFSSSSVETCDSPHSVHSPPSEVSQDESRPDGGPTTHPGGQAFEDVPENSASSSLNGRFDLIVPPFPTPFADAPRRDGVDYADSPHSPPSEVSRDEPRLDGGPAVHLSGEGFEGLPDNSAPTTPSSPTGGFDLFVPRFPTPFADAPRPDGVDSTPEDPLPSPILDPQESSVDHNPRSESAASSPLILPSDSSLEDGLSTTHSSPSLPVTSISLPSTARPSAAPSRSTARAEVASTAGDSPTSLPWHLPDALDDIILIPPSPVEREVPVVTEQDASESESESMHSLCLRPATASLLSQDEAPVATVAEDELDHAKPELEYLDEYPLPPMTPLSVDQISLPLSLDSSFGFPSANDFGWEIVQHPSASASPSHDDDGDPREGTGVLFAQGPSPNGLAAPFKTLRLRQPRAMQSPPTPVMEGAADEGGVRVTVNGESEDDWRLPPLHFHSPSLSDDVLSSPEFLTTTLVSSQDIGNSSTAMRALAPTRTRHTRAFSASNAIHAQRKSIVWAPHDTRHDPESARKARAQPQTRPRARTVSAGSGLASTSDSRRGRGESESDGGGPTEVERLRARMLRREKQLQVKRDRVAELEQQLRETNNERRSWWSYLLTFPTANVEDIIM